MPRRWIWILIGVLAVPFGIVGAVALAVPALRKSMPTSEVPAGE